MKSSLTITLLLAVFLCLSGCKEPSYKVTHTYHWKPKGLLGVLVGSEIKQVVVVTAEIAGTKESVAQHVSMITTACHAISREVLIKDRKLVVEMYEKVGFSNVEVSVFDSNASEEGPRTATEKPDSLTPEQRALVAKAKRQAQEAAEGKRQELFAQFLRK